MGLRPVRGVLGLAVAGDAERGVRRSRPVAVGAEVEEVLGGLVLAAVSGLPERVGDVVAGGSWRLGEVALDQVEAAERGCVRPA